MAKNSTSGTKFKTFCFFKNSGLSGLECISILVISPLFFFQNQQTIIIYLK